MTAEENNPGCLASFCNEIKPCQPWFKVKEPTTNRSLDIPATFGPSDAVSILCKCLVTGYAIATQILSWVESDKLYFYYAYFTSWALLFAVIYIVTSLINSFFPPEQPKGTRVQGRIKFTWLLFVLSVFSQALATIIFWILVFEPDDGASYLDVATHGIVFVVLMFEGFMVNRIPLRWTHIWAAFTILAIFLIWSVIHGPIVLDLGNPNEEDNDPDTNDDAIYTSLSWDEDDISSTVVLVALVYFIGVPIIYGILRAISLWNWPCCCPKDRRRYIRTASDIANKGIQGSESDTKHGVDEETASGNDNDVYVDEVAVTY